MFCSAKTDPLDLIDMLIRNLCVGPCAPKQPKATTHKSRQQQQEQQPQEQQQQPQLLRPQPVQFKKRRTQVLYPIAKYASTSQYNNNNNNNNNNNSNLDNDCPRSKQQQQQEQQRRRPMQEDEHLQFFRPVHAADAEHVHSAAKKPKLDLA